MVLTTRVARGAARVATGRRRRRGSGLLALGIVGVIFSILGIAAGITLPIVIAGFSWWFGVAIIVPCVGIFLLSMLFLLLGLLLCPGY